MALWKSLPGKLPRGKIPLIKLHPPVNPPLENSNKIPTLNSPTHFIN